MITKYNLNFNEITFVSLEIELIIFNLKLYKDLVIL